jgi:hypothetical protein
VLVIAAAAWTATRGLTGGKRSSGGLGA